MTHEELMDKLTKAKRIYENSPKLRDDCIAYAEAIEALLPEFIDDDARRAFELTAEAYRNIADTR